MKILPLLLLLPLCVTPASAQSPTYTNADLSPHPVTAWTRTVTPEQLESLRAHQFVYVPPSRPTAPGIYVLASSPTDGPFGAFAPFPVPTRLDGTAYTEPPWVQVTYGAYGHGRAPHGAQSTLRPWSNRTTTSTRTTTRSR